MAIEDVEVRKSGIHGWGLYAVRAFVPGEIVLRWSLAETIPVEKLASLSEDQRRYTHPLDDRRVLIVQEPERFVNHSCQNNTEVLDFCDVAIVAIAAGDEITSNYGTDGSNVSFKCLCGTDACRGVVGK